MELIADVTALRFIAPTQRWNGSSARNYSLTVEVHRICNTALARGGKTPMLGQGDRTTTAPADAAGPAKPGTTAHLQEAPPGLPKP